MPPWVPRLVLLVILSGFAAYAVLMLLRELRPVLIWLLVALFLSFAMEPAVNWLVRRGWRRGAATGLVLAALALGFLAMLALMIPLVIAQVSELVRQLPGWLERASRLTERWFDIELTGEAIVQRIGSAQDALARIATNIAQAGAVILGALFQMLTIGLFAFYLVADGPRFRRAVCRLLPPRRQREVLDAWEIAIEKTGGYLYSRLLLAAISAVASFITLTVLGVPFALPLALWLGFLSQFIPVVGTYIAAAVPLLVALLDRPFSALIFLGYVLVYQQVENYLLAPRISARTMQLHPAVAFFAALAGGALSGVVGAFLALPAAAIIQAVVSTYVRTHEVVETELTRDDRGAPAPPAGARRSWVARVLARGRAETRGGG
jgi:predicted PurR-regulated permease PerM